MVSVFSNRMTAHHIISRTSVVTAMIIITGTITTSIDNLSLTDRPDFAELDVSVRCNGAPPPPDFELFCLDELLPMVKRYVKSDSSKYRARAVSCAVKLDP